MYPSTYYDPIYTPNYNMPSPYYAPSPYYYGGYQPEPFPYSYRNLPPYLPSYNRPYYNPYSLNRGFYGQRPYYPLPQRNNWNTPYDRPNSNNTNMPRVNFINQRANGEVVQDGAVPLSKEQLNQLTRILNAPLVSDPPGQVLQVLDMNGDGKLSAGDAAQTMKRNNRGELDLSLTNLTQDTINRLTTAA